MSEFYKSIKENLENRPEPAFDPLAWKAMEKRLDQLQSGKSRPFLWWWAACLALLLLSLGGNAFLLGILKNQDRNLSNRENSTIFESRTDNSNDTVYREKIIIQRDTIYQIKTIRQPVLVQNQFSVPPQWNIAPKKLFSERVPLIETFDSGKSHWTLIAALTDSRRRAEILETTANRAFERNSPFGPVPHLPPAGPLVTAFDPQLERDRFPSPELDSSIPLAYYLRPTGLQVGLSAGPGYPLSEQHRREDGFSVGVTAELEFPHLYGFGRTSATFVCNWMPMSWMKPSAYRSSNRLRTIFAS